MNPEKLSQETGKKKRRVQCNRKLSPLMLVMLTMAMMTTKIMMMVLTLMLMSKLSNLGVHFSRKAEQGERGKEAGWREEEQV